MERLRWRRMGSTRALDGRGTIVAKELPRRPWRSSAFTRGRREAGRERCREGASERGNKLGIHFRRAQRRDRGIPRGSNGGHALCMVATHGHASPLEAFYRARGGRRYDRRGEPIWAASGLNQTLGQKRSLITSACSTFFIKAL